MAKRLNKKVVLIGFVVLLLLALGGIAVIFNLSRDPQKFIRDGDAAFLAKDYKKAVENYNRARARAKDDQLRIKMLFKLTEIYHHTGEWNYIVGCWTKISQIAPDNIESRLALLNYYYIIADSGAGGFWKEVESKASELLDIIQKQDLLAENASKFTSVGEEAIDRPLRSYLYELRGRAILEMAKSGTSMDANEAFVKAGEDLKKVVELEPGNIDAYWYLAQTKIAAGEFLKSKGNVQSKKDALEQAQSLLEKAVEQSADNPKARVNLLKLKTFFARDDAERAKENIESLEKEYTALVNSPAGKKNALAFYELGGYYQNPAFGTKNLEKALDAFEKALELEPNNFAYTMDAANAHYRIYSIYGKQEELNKALALAKHALLLPEAQDITGPKQMINRYRKVSANSFLAYACLEYVIDHAQQLSKEQKDSMLADSESAIHDIEQFIGSGEDPRIAKWRGLLELAKGENTPDAIKQMYGAYNQFKATGQNDSQLCYTLWNVFKNTSELGSAKEFLESAFNSGIAWMKPEVILDYADLLLKLRAVDEVLKYAELFESRYWSNNRSKSLRINAYIGSKRFDDAAKVIAKLEPDDPNRIVFQMNIVKSQISELQWVLKQKQDEESLKGIITSKEDQKEDKTLTADSQKYQKELAGLFEKSLSLPNRSLDLAAFTMIYNYDIEHGQKGQAKILAEQCLKHFPDNTSILYYKRLLDEPDPMNISQQKRDQIEESVLSDINEPVNRSMGLAAFYRRINDPNKAAIQYQKVLKVKPVDISKEDIGQIPELDKDSNKAAAQRVAVGTLFDMALAAKNWTSAERLIEVAKRDNIDSCEGKYFNTRILMAKKDYKNALTEIEDCLKQRPVFSYGYLMRSQINSALGNDLVAVEDIQKAASLNYLDGDIAKQLFFTLYGRNQKLGGTVTAEQKTEVRNALNRAMLVNPSDSQLLSLYAEFISTDEPTKALAIRQKLQKDAPSIENAVLLAEMAMRLAGTETDANRKQALFEVAKAALDQGKAINPQSDYVLDSYSRYYRLTGQEEKGQQMLEQTSNKRLLYSHYYQAGQFQEAKKVLEQIYSSEPHDSNLMKALVAVSEQTNDANAIKKYSDELVSIEDNSQNRLLQLQNLIKFDFIKESEQKLQGFKEKYPNDSRVVLLESWLLTKQGQMQKALDLVNTYIEKDQKNAVAWQLRGEINRVMANYDQSIEDLKNSKLLADVPSTRITLAKVYLRAGRKEPAIAELKAVVDNPQSPPQARQLLEQVYIMTEEKKSLKQFYNETLEKLPDNVFWLNRAATFALMEKDFSRAEQLYEQALAKAQKNGDLAEESLNGYYQTLLAAGKPDKVLSLSQKYIDGGLAPIAYVGMAEAKLKLGDNAAALAYCRTAADKVKNNDRLNAWVLQRMYSLFGYQETLKYCQERLKTEPDSLVANFTMFNILTVNSEYNKAIHYIDKCIKIGGTDTEQGINYAIRKAILLQMAYDKTSDYNYLENAIAQYESLLAKMPNNSGVLNNLAYMLVDNDKKLNEALKYAKKAYDTESNNASFMDTYAWALYKNGKYQEAAEIMQAALLQHEKNNMVAPSAMYEHLAMMKEKLGETDKALDAYKQALEAEKDKMPPKVAERIKANIDRLSKK